MRIGDLELIKKANRKERWPRQHQSISKLETMTEIGVVNKNGYKLENIISKSLKEYPFKQGFQ